MSMILNEDEAGNSRVDFLAGEFRDALRLCALWVGGACVLVPLAAHLVARMGWLA